MKSTSIFLCNLVRTFVSVEIFLYMTPRVLLFIETVREDVEVLILPLSSVRLFLQLNELINEFYVRQGQRMLSNVRISCPSRKTETNNIRIFLVTRKIL